MTRIAAVLLSVSLLLGCTPHNEPLDRATELRKQLLAANGCEFEVNICADYTQEVYEFEMHCAVDSTGKLSFTVLEPESIRGICGSIDDTASSLSFADTVLAFPLLAEGRISPVSAPWLFIKTLRGGYLAACGEAQDGFVISMDDSYDENPLHLEIYTDTNMVPTGAEVYWQQKRVITLEIKNFVLL